MWTRAQLKANAKIIFKRNYWPCVGVSLLLTVLGCGEGSGSIGSSLTNTFSDSDLGYGSGISEQMAQLMATIGIIVAIIGIVAIFYSIFVANVIEVGGCRYFINNRTGEAQAGDLFGGFRGGNYSNIVFVQFMRNLFITLWTLLLIIPGIIKSYQYYLVPYILADNPGMKYQDALDLSKRMMDGQKMATFVLELSFIGWDILNALTLGILGILYVTPYKRATRVELYEYSKVVAYNEGYIG